MIAVGGSQPVTQCLARLSEVRADVAKEALNLEFVTDLEDLLSVI